MTKIRFLTSAGTYIYILIYPDPIQWVQGILSVGVKQPEVEPD